MSLYDCLIKCFVDEMLGIVQINIEKFFAREMNNVEKDVIHWARKTENEAVKLAPSYTGNLRRSAFFDFKRNRNQM